MCFVILPADEAFQVTDETSNSNKFQLFSFCTSVYYDLDDGGAPPLPTFAQFVPATRQDTSPPNLLAAVMALRVIGVSVSLLCSATTKVL